MLSSNTSLSEHKNDGKSQYGGRALIGYANNPPNPKWPKNAKVALNFVINYEEGGERCILHGDNESENLLSDIIGVPSLEGERNVNVESMYDYGSRTGFWRLYRLFNKKKFPCTVFAVGMALERNPTVCYELQKCDTWEIASHGYRWIDYQNVDEDIEREHIKRTVEIHKKLLGKRPAGFYQGKPNANTRKLVIEEGGFKYDSDSYADDLPYWSMDHGDAHLIIPYTLTENDMRFTTANGWGSGDDFLKHLKETLRYLIDEGRAGSPKMMTVGLHCRLARPGRVAAIEQFMDYVRSYGKEVWVCTREEIADHWIENHAPRGRGSKVMSPGQPDYFEGDEDEEGEGEAGGGDII